ncbi:MAG: hypothetical protein V4537_14165 [Pseudomonadota bacterium]
MKRRSLLMGIPIEAVAYAAGVRSVTQLGWDEIALAVRMLGLGSYSAVNLDVAVSQWSLERIDAMMGGDVEGIEVIEKPPRHKPS